MICVRVDGPTLFDVKKQMRYAADYGDMVELRMNLWARHKVEEVREVIQEYPVLRTVFVLRPKPETPELRRVNEIEALAALKPSFFDIENGMPMQMRRTLVAKFPQIQWIMSEHPEQFEEKAFLSLYEKHFKDFPKAYLKITMKAKTAAEALRFCLWMYERKNPRLLGGIEMPHGGFSWVISSVIGTPWTYAAAEEKKHAHGLIPAQVLRESYCLRKSRGCDALVIHLSKEELSPAYLRLYNQALVEENFPVLLAGVQSQELGACWKLLRQLPVRGMALEGEFQKEVMDYLDYIDPSASKTEAVDTVLFDGEISYGFNTKELGDKLASQIYLWFRA